MANNLRVEGYFVLEACDGAEALRIVIGQSRQIHVLLTKLRVQGTNLAETLKPYRPEMQALFFTGSQEKLLAQLRQILKPQKESAATEWRTRAPARQTPGNLPAGSPLNRRGEGGSSSLPAHPEESDLTPE
jgi:hypothetical protein